MSIEKTIFGKTSDGRNADLYKLVNSSGMTLVTTTYGCRIVNLLVLDKNGNSGDVVLGHKTIEEYFGSNYQGTFVGRYANRIGNAQFTLNGVQYILDKNDGNNSLHGGTGGYHQILWDVEDIKDCDEPSISFAYTSPDMEEGYPGELKIKVRYTLTKDNELKIDYIADTNKETVFNPTNHAFFNLSGNFTDKILDTYLTINADKTTLVSEELIPTGEIASVIGTGLDFTECKKLGENMFSAEETIALPGGFDHNYCVAGEGFRKFAEAYEPVSGRVMEVFSDLPAVQLYTFNSVSDNLINKDGSKMQPHTAFCLETQFYPDSPNKEHFPFKTVKPGETFKSSTVYKFSTK